MLPMQAPFDSPRVIPARPRSSRSPWSIVQYIHSSFEYIYIYIYISFYRPYLWSLACSPANVDDAQQSIQSQLPSLMGGGGDNQSCSYSFLLYARQKN